MENEQKKDEPLKLNTDLKTAVQLLSSNVPKKKKKKSAKKKK